MSEVCVPNIAAANPDMSEEGSKKSCLNGSQH